MDDEEDPGGGRVDPVSAFFGLWPRFLADEGEEAPDGDEASLEQAEA